MAGKVNANTVFSAGLGPRGRAAAWVVAFAAAVRNADGARRRSPY